MRFPGNYPAPISSPVCCLSRAPQPCLLKLFLPIVFALACFVLILIIRLVLIHHKISDEQSLDKLSSG